MNTRKIDLLGAQALIARLMSRLESPEQGQQPGESTWDNRALGLFSALLPILAWPGAADWLSDRDLLDLDELIALANASDPRSFHASRALRYYVGTLPGMRYHESGTLEYVPGCEATAVEHHGYLAMQWEAFCRRAAGDV